jgi:hypothetical protein
MTSTLPKLKPSPSTTFLVDVEPPSIIPLQGFSAFYLAHALPAIPSHRSHQLIFLRPNLYGLLRDSKTSARILVPPTPDVLTMVPRRDIPKPRRGKTENQSLSSHRYVLLVYKPFKEVTRRQKASRLTMRLPAIRVKPGLLLVPQIKASRFQEYQSTLIRPSEFARELVQLGATVWYASRLEVYTSEDLIGSLIKEAFIARSKRIAATCKELYKELRMSKRSVQEVRERLKLIRLRLRLHRAQGRFFAKECGLDFQYAVSRAAAAVSRLQSSLELCD